MKILVIGSGSIGRRHADNAAALGAAVTPVSWRATTLDALNDMMARQRFDGAVIATATDIRLPLVSLCAGHGLPIYLEKPIAFEGAELDAILSAAEPVAARSVAGFMMRYHPAFGALMSADRSDVFRFSFEIGHDVTQWRANWRFADSYAARAQGGGVLLDLCHELDMAACLFPGLVLDAVSSLGHSRFPGVDMASRISLTAPSGASGEVAMDYLAPRLIRRARMAGQAASHDFDFAGEAYHVATAQGVETLAMPLARNAMFMALMGDFLALVAGRPTSGNPALPRLDRVADSAKLIASAWQARRFTGMITKEF